MTTQVIIPASDGTRKVTAGYEGMVYTCPMHPEIEQVGPGSCPICGMDLTPIRDQAGPGGATTGEREVVYWRAPMDPTEIYDARMTYLEEEYANTEVKTVLVLKVGGQQAGRSHGIHWHVDPDHEVRVATRQPAELVAAIEAAVCPK